MHLNIRNPFTVGGGGRPPFAEEKTNPQGLKRQAHGNMTSTGRTAIQGHVRLTPNPPGLLCACFSTLSSACGVQMSEVQVAALWPWASYLLSTPVCLREPARNSWGRTRTASQGGASGDLKQGRGSRRSQLCLECPVEYICQVLKPRAGAAHADGACPRGIRGARWASPGSGSGRCRALCRSAPHSVLLTAAVARASAGTLCRLEVLRQRDTEALNVAGWYRDPGDGAPDHLAPLPLPRGVKFPGLELFLYFSVSHEL